MKPLEFVCYRCGTKVAEPAGHAMSHELTDSPWGYLRGKQWDRPSAGGALLTIPLCLRTDYEADAIAHLTSNQPTSPEGGDVRA